LTIWLGSKKRRRKTRSHDSISMVINISGVKREEMRKKESKKKHVKQQSM